MRKTISVITVILAAGLLTGCAPKMVGDIKDWSECETEDFKVHYAMSDYGFYSDGSAEGNALLGDWYAKHQNEGISRR